MPWRVMTETVTVTTTGSAGSATGTADTRAMNGFLLDVFLDYHASAPATTDLLILYLAPSNGQILAVANSVTDNFHAPRKQATDASGAAIVGQYELYPLDGTIQVQLAQSDALAAAVVVRFRYLRGY